MHVGQGNLGFLYFVHEDNPQLRVHFDGNSFGERAQIEICGQTIFSRVQLAKECAESHHAAILSAIKGEVDKQSERIRALEEALTLGLEYASEALANTESSFGAESPRCNLDRLYLKQMQAALSPAQKEGV